MKGKGSVKIYHGYGHTHNLVLYGHVFKNKAKTTQRYSKKLTVNILHLLRLFIVKPYPFIKVSLNFNGQIIESQTGKDGFFKLEWAALTNVEAGWHKVTVTAINKKGNIFASGDGSIYVPHVTQHILISDIDDTVMISHSATIIKRLRELLIKNPHTRKTFQSTVNHYQLLATAHTDINHPNPFFYVSSSEWNLYDYLVETFRFNGFPEGAFLLNSLKRWKDLMRTGKTGHEGKLLRVMRIIDAFPNQKFILFGDNSQQDPAIYYKIAEKYANNIKAIYIRNVSKKKLLATKELLAKLEQKNISTCLFTHSDEAIAHSKQIGLIN